MTALATDSGRKTPARLAGSAILALQSDDRLVKLVRSGHERAFDAIVERYRKPLVHFCGRMLPESRCEDAVQQAFINAHAALTTSDEPVQLKPWLFAITRNAALNMLRQNGWSYDQIPLDFDGVRRPDQEFEQRVELEQTVAALNELPERQRDALVMREFEGRSYDEIAAALGANGGAVRQLLNRARVTLRSAASMLVPPPLVVRAASALPPSDGRRIAEIVGGLGTAGVVKAGATVLVAGSLVVGAVEAPIGPSHKTTREKATLRADDNSPRAAARDVTVASHAGTTAAQLRSAGAAVERPSSNSGTGHAAPAPSRENEHSGSGEDRGSSGDDTRERSGTSGGGDDRTRTRSGSDDSTTRSGSDDHSGSGSSGSGSGDVMATAPTGSDGGGTSGSSGPGSGELSSGSGTSGSGDSGGTTTTTTTTTTASSGSGSSGSGSDDTLEH
jgi:RNA polymerase sigma factor (sigma-70 family)